MAYVGIDSQGARALGGVLRDTATRAETVRRQVVGALNLAELTSQAPLQLALVQDGFTTLGTGVIDKADLAEQFAIDPRGVATSLGATTAELGSVLGALLGFAGPRDLRTILVGLAPAGRDAALDAALARLSPVLMPALLAGQRPDLPAELLPDLRVLALALGIEHAGPPVPQVDGEQTGSGFLGLFRRRAEERTTEVFWQDFWSDGRSVNDVLADPQRLLDWVAGTVELDHRLARAADLPRLGDVLATHDFATAESAPAELAAKIAAAEVEFAAIADWLPAHLVGRDTTAPDDTQLGQTLAFAARVGWTDPGATAATPAARFAAAVAFLRANRMVQSALLPTGFEGDTDPTAFFNEAGIDVVLRFGRTAGAIDESYTVGLAGLVDQAMTAAGVDLSSATPIELTQPIQQQLFALVASQIPRSMAESPAVQAQFVGALSYLRGATDGPQLRERINRVVTAFRSLAVVGAPALTERELTAVVGANVVDALGRGRLRLRSRDAVERSPEFLILARQWGIPGGRSQDLGKHKLNVTFDDLGVLTDISRRKKKKKGFLSRIFDTVKSIGKAIVTAWKDNPFKAIFQIGKIALGVASLVVPGLQAVGIATLAVNAVEAVSHAIDGNWLGAIGAGLSAFTAGADLLGTAAGAAKLVGQSSIVGDLFDAGTTLDVLRNAKRAFDIGASVFQASQANTVIGAITAGLGAAGSVLGNGGPLLASLDLIDKNLALDLVRLGTSVRDVTRLVTPAAGVIQALDRGDALAAFGNGLAVVSAGAAALLNPRGVLGDPKTVAGTAFDFDPKTRTDLADLAKGTGIMASLAQAISAVDAGRPFVAGQALAQALRIARTAPQVGPDAAVVAQRVAEVGVVLEGVFRGVDPRLAAPLVVQRLRSVLDALRPTGVPGGPAGGDESLVLAAGATTMSAAPTTFGPLPGSAGTAPPNGTPAISTLAGGAGESTLAGGAGADTLGDGFVLAQATGGPAAGQPTMTLPGSTTPIPLQPGTQFIPPGATVVGPDGTVYGGDSGLVPGASPGAMSVPGGMPPAPGQIKQLPGGYLLFFLDRPEDMPQSRLDDLDDPGIGGGGTRLASLAGASLFGGPTSNQPPGVPSGDLLLTSTASTRDELGRINLPEGFGRDPDSPFYVPVPAEPQLHPIGQLFVPPADGPSHVWAAPQNPAFIANHVLDGGSRTKESIFNIVGWGASAQGPHNASESVYVGVRNGLLLIDNDTAPVDGLTIGGVAGFSYQAGNYGLVTSLAGEVNLGPILDLRLPTLALDGMAAVNIPYIGAVGFRANSDGFRLAEQSDFAEGVAIGPGALVTVKYPVSGELAVERIAELAGVSTADVRIAQHAPPGSLLAFDVRDEFRAPFEPTFAERPGFPDPDIGSAAALGPKLGLPDGFSVDPGGAYAPPPDDLYRYGTAGSTDLASWDDVSEYELPDLYHTAYDTMIGLGAPEGTTVDFGYGADFWDQTQPSAAYDDGAPALLGPALDAMAWDPQLESLPGIAIGYDEFTPLDLDVDDGWSDW
ncbi:hypothetical protein [Micromonospora sediminimaris]|uniref:Uncharacterized protein n=1 Tax=Micromonospora sediminimaris TaxID=547162 RepID=A0A9W5XHX2_9ACTN|nr:hypothetical protein [Micromonospora sediminimaris]GIJ31625.1 hypothetical protein Vse01_07730 [Micromonospora sediminimaris]SFC34502.1 hypothetical protein SAMN05216284_10421 [Micromonospora sediminimaris]